MIDELKNRWGWGGFTTRDLTRCRLLAGMIALIHNWRSLFVRLADPEDHSEAITSRPCCLSAIGRRTHHAGQVTLTVSSKHVMQHKALRVCICIAGFLAEPRKTAVQLDIMQRWYRILSEALRHFLKGANSNRTAIKPSLTLPPVVIHRRSSAEKGNCRIYGQSSCRRHNAWQTDRDGRNRPSHRMRQPVANPPTIVGVRSGAVNVRGAQAGNAEEGDPGGVRQLDGG